ncbi:hypothetical protein [Flavobacterium sp. HNIBRBA15423]|uniref:hypothetical protein n=1 Tax=Flavobacterium sp. HNIBRBA15423 TaxID=3458683 RepID=UPI004044067F
MKKTIILFTIVIFSLKSYSQNEINFIFKTLLVLDNAISLKLDDSITALNKEMLLENISLEVNELNTNMLKPNFFDNYRIYRFNLQDNKIDYKSDVPIIFNISSCSEFAIIYNEKTEKYYRIKGFKSNDFNSLINDIILYYERKLRPNDIVKNLIYLNYQGLDFECMYNALKDSPNNIWKYECMKVCTNAKPSHSSR